MVPTDVGVFFGQLDKRAKGWYWADSQSEKPKAAFRGHSRRRNRRWTMRSAAFGKLSMRRVKEAPRDYFGY
jgi:hypothetical protein